MIKQIFICLGSGVIYAAFLQSGTNIHPLFLLLSLFLPILLYVPAIILGSIGVSAAALPIIVMLLSQTENILPFLIFNTSPAFLVGYIFYDRHRFHQKDGSIFGIQTAVETAAYGQIIIFGMFLFFPQTWNLLGTGISKLQSVVQQMEGLNQKVSFYQLSMIMPMVYIFLNIYCVRLSTHIVKRLEPNFKELEENYNYSPWIDIPVLSLLLLQTLGDLVEFSTSVQFVINGFLVLSLWPVLFLGIQVFKTIGNYYGFSQKIINVALFVLFFLVHPLIFIVLLGLMESSSSISQRFRRKHF